MIRHLSFTLPLLVACFIFGQAAATFASADNELFPPADYLYSKLQKNDIVFLGTTHKKIEILGFIAELIPSLTGLGVTYIGLEIPSDQQDNIDAFMLTGKGLNDIKLHSQIDYPDYRNLFKVLRDSGGPNPMAIDLPYTMYAGDVSRDERMARSLLAIVETDPTVKILVILGSLHTLKKLEWEEHVPNKRKSIREIIALEKPTIKMWSIGQVIGKTIEQCDFTERFGPLPDAVALDLDERYRGWKLGMTSTIAIVTAECFELLDGLIVY